jgi:Fe-S-cluster formation regulator IscX/YfhJ
MIVDDLRRIAKMLFEDTEKTDPEILARALMKILKDRSRKSGIDPRKVFEMFTRMRP